MYFNDSVIAEIEKLKAAQESLGLHILIVGGGLCGLALSHALQRHYRPCQLTILERSPSLGAESAFACPQGAQALSFNVSDHEVASTLRRLEPHLKLIEDAELSETMERRHGWSRSSGQWLQYKLVSPYSELLQTFLGEGQAQLLLNTSVTSLSVHTSKKKWIVHTDAGVERECDVLCLALPAAEICHLIAPLTPFQLPQNVADVVQQSASQYTTRYAVLVSFPKNSGLAKAVAKMFGSAWEVDVSSTDHGVTLLSKAEERHHEPGNPRACLAVHALVGSALDKSALLEFLSCFLGVVVSDKLVEFSDVAVFQQAGFSRTPLFPLTNSGFILVQGKESPPCLLLGDWAAGGGVVSHGLASALKAAKKLVELFPQHEETENYEPE